MTSAKEWLIERGYDDTIIFGDVVEEYGSAFIGISTDGRAVYDYDKMVRWLMDDQGWSQEDAEEWINFNTINAKVDGSPIIIFSVTEDA